MPKSNFSTHQVLGSAGKQRAVVDNTSITSLNNILGSNRQYRTILDPASGDPNTYVEIAKQISLLVLKSAFASAAPPILELHQIGSGGGVTTGVPQVIFYEEHVGFLTDEVAKQYVEI